MKQRPITVFAFLAPSLVGLTVFFLVPFLDMVRRSFLSASGERFAGWDNYAAVLGNEAFLLAAGNTAKFMLACIPVLLALSLALALAVRESTPFRRLAKTAFLVPCAVPVYAAALLAGLAFDARGMVNGVLAAWNVHPVAWLTSDAAFWVLVASYVWRNLGYCVVLWLAALSCIPEHVFEAARIDGARPATVLRRVTLPLAGPSVPVVSVLAVVNAFKVYREAYLVAGNYPHESMYLLPHLFNNWFASLSLEKLAAGSVLLALTLLVFICVLFLAWNSQDRGK